MPTRPALVVERSSTMSIEMSVQQIFHFSDGRTVFLGTMEGDRPAIRSCRAELWVANALQDSFYLEGEMINEVRRILPPTIRLRSVSTAAVVTVDPAVVEGGECRLRIFPEQMNPAQPTSTKRGRSQRPVPSGRQK